MDASLQLGAFRLQHPLGKGGMARVVRATHIHHHQPVAIKVMTGERARKQRFVESFHREVRAVARMNHPNIIRVFDYGEISDEIADASEGWLSGGSPYMAMELADSTLARLDHDQLSWPHVHTMLVSILDALAHAHARGLIHRDLKPDNVLFFSDPNGGQLKLSDFGIAFRLDEKRQLLAEDETITGTPRYMAPEQIRGRIREQGPWTDLYAVGCLAYWLVGGEPPFSGQSVEEVLRAHLSAPRPPLEKRLEVPEEFEAWTSRLVARDPTRRFRRAADAAAALAKLTDDKPLEQMVIGARSPDGEPTKVRVVAESIATRAVSQPTTPASKRRGSFEQFTDDLPDIPGDWRHARPTGDSMQMVGVGQNLFELREVPLVGRRQLRDALWQQLWDTCHTARPHAAILEGPVGVGKTRLARWLAHRAHEVGAAQVMYATHSPLDAPTEGLARMFADHLRCTGLDREALFEHIRGLYETETGLNADELHQCVALTDLIAPAADPDFDEENQTLRFTDPQQRWVVFRRLLAKLAQCRPVVMVLDDIHWGNKSLQFLEYLLDPSIGHQLPVLAVVTNRRKLAADNPRAFELLEQLGESPRSKRLEVEPLPENNHRQLVERLLCLHSGLAEEVVDRTRGNPLFAIQVVGDWIERDLLVVGEEGFELADDTATELPDNVRSLLIRRLEHHIGHPVHLPGEGLMAVELGAVLGGEVDGREWRVVCEVAGIDPPHELLERLAAHSLVRRTEQGWSFSHGALRETLLEIAEDAERLVDHHSRCVEMLDRLYDTSHQRLAPRVADHLLGAEAWEDALEPLCRAMEYCHRISDYESGLEYARRHETTRKQLGLDDDDRRSVRGSLRRIDLCVSLGRNEAARRLLDKSAQICRSNERNDQLGLVYERLAGVHCRQGNYEEAIELGEQALALHPNDSAHQVRTLRAIGWSLVRQSRCREAKKIAHRAKGHLQDLDQPKYSAFVFNLLAAIHNQLDNSDVAREYYQTALSHCEDIGDLRGIAIIHNNLGDLHRTIGDDELAAQHYTDATELHRRLGDLGEFRPESNLGVLRLEQGDPTAARKHFQTARQTLQQASHMLFATMSHLGLAACAAARDDIAVYDQHFAAAEARLAENSPYSDGIGFLTEYTGERLVEHGRHDRARDAWRLAMNQWRELGETDRADELEQQLEALPSLC